MEGIANLEDATKHCMDPLNRKKKVGNYLLGKIIGEGSFAKVREGLHIIAREKVAVKIVSKRAVLVRELVKRSVRREAVILQRLEHPGIVRLYEIMETENSYYLVMELAASGEFIKYLADKKRLPETECQKFIRQLTSALDHMHTSNIAHRDLKLENLLLDKDHNIKIIDFGLSNVFYGDTSLSTQCGSPVYAAPEIFCNRKYGPAVDVWSMGICMYAMLTGKLPFMPDPPNNLTLLHTMILRGAHMPDHVTPECVQLLTGLLTVDVNHRIKVEDILTHPWLHENHVTPLVTRQPPIGKLYPQIPKTEIVTYMTSVFSFLEDDIFYSVIERKMNAVAATYHLVLKRYEAGLKLIGFTGISKTLNSQSANPRKKSEGSQLEDSRIELPVLKVQKANVSDVDVSRSTYRNYSQHLKDSKLRSAPNLRSGNTRHKDISLRRHRTKPDIAKFTRTQEEFGFMPDFILTYTQEYTPPARKFEWEQTFVVSRKEPKQFDKSSHSKSKMKTNSGKSQCRVSTSGSYSHSSDIREREKDLRSVLELKVPPTTPMSPRTRDTQYTGSAQSRGRFDIESLKLNLEEDTESLKLNFEDDTKPISDPCNEESWSTFHKQKTRLSRGVNLATRKNNVNFQFGGPLTKPKTLTPREASCYFEEFENAQIVGQGRRLLERSRTTAGRIEELHSIWTRQSRTANGRREFPDIGSGNRPHTHEIPYRTVDSNGVIQFPEVTQQESRVFETRSQYSEKETIVDGVTDVIKVHITGAAKI